MKDLLVVVALSLLILGGLAVVATVATDGVRQIGPDGEVIILPSGEPWSDPASQAAQPASEAVLPPASLSTAASPAVSVDNPFPSARDTAADPADDFWPGQSGYGGMDDLAKPPGITVGSILVAAALSIIVLIFVGRLVRNSRPRSRSRATAALHETVSATYAEPPAREAFRPRRPAQMTEEEAQVRGLAWLVGQTLAELGYFYQGADHRMQRIGFSRMMATKEGDMLLLEVDLERLPPGISQDDLLAEQTLQYLSAVLRCPVHAFNTTGVTYVVLPR